MLGKWLCLVRTFSHWFFFSFTLQVGWHKCFHRAPPPHLPSEQSLASCGSTSPLSKISPGHFPPYRKWQEMTLLDLAVRQHFLQSLLRGSEVFEKVDWERLGPWDGFSVIRSWSHGKTWVCVYVDSCIISLWTKHLSENRDIDASLVPTATGKVPVTSVHLK